MKRAFLSIAVAVALQSGTGFANESGQFRNAVQRVAEPKMPSAEQVLMAGAKYQQAMLESMISVAEIIETPEQMREFLASVAEEGRANMVDAAAQCLDYYSTDELQSLAQRCINQEMDSLTLIESLVEVEFTEADVKRFQANMREVARQRVNLQEQFVASVAESVRLSSRAPLDQELRSTSNHAASLVRCAAHAIQPIVTGRVLSAPATSQP